MVNFRLSEGDRQLALVIANRAVADGLYDSLRNEHGNRKAAHSDKLLTAEMDIAACHVNGCPLRLGELAGADRFNFIHDVAGIRDHMNRETGKLDGMFHPRFSKHR